MREAEGKDGKRGQSKGGSREGRGETGVRAGGGEGGRQQQSEGEVRQGRGVRGGAGEGGGVIRYTQRATLCCVY